MSAELLRKAATILRERTRCEDCHNSQRYDDALADWLSATEEHVASYDCEAHCEPDGCGPTRRAIALARLIVGDES